MKVMFTEKLVDTLNSLLAVGVNDLGKWHWSSYEQCWFHGDEQPAPSDGDCTEYCAWEPALRFVTNAMKVSNVVFISDHDLAFVLEDLGYEVEFVTRELTSGFSEVLYIKVSDPDEDDWDEYYERCTVTVLNVEGTGAELAPVAWAFYSAFATGKIRNVGAVDCPKFAPFRRYRMTVYRTVFWGSDPEGYDLWVHPLSLNPPKKQAPSVNDVRCDLLHTATLSLYKWLEDRAEFTRDEKGIHLTLGGKDIDTLIRRKAEGDIGFATALKVVAEAAEWWAEPGELGGTVKMLPYAPIQMVGRWNEVKKNLFSHTKLNWVEEDPYDYPAEPVFLI